MVKINSRMGEQRQDILNDPWVRDEIHPFLELLKYTKISVEEFQLAVLEICTRFRTDKCFWSERLDICQTQKTDYVFWREDFGGRDITVSFLYLEPSEVHPPHHHNDVISVQTVAMGQIWAREYQRIRCLPNSKILISPVSERLLTDGGIIIANEWYNNVHWFVATENTPAILWNCNIRGFENALFHNPRPETLGRILIDPHYDVLDNKLVAKKLNVSEAYEKFGGKPLSEWPIPKTVSWVTSASSNIYHNK